MAKRSYPKKSYPFPMKHAIVPREVVRRLGYCSVSAPDVKDSYCDCCLSEKATKMVRLGGMRHRLCDPCYKAMLSRLDCMGQEAPLRHIVELMGAGAGMRDASDTSVLHDYARAIERILDEGCSETPENIARLGEFA